MTGVTTMGQLSWNVARVAGSREDVATGELAVEGNELRFLPKSESAAWGFRSELAKISEVTTIEPTLKNSPWSLEQGIRVRTSTGSQATFYLMGRARDRADAVVAGISELVKSSQGPNEATTPTNFVDGAENAPVNGSTKFVRTLLRFSWLFGVLGLAFLIPELLTRLGDSSTTIERVWLLIHPGIFIAICIELTVGRFVDIARRNHPVLAVLPFTLYLVGASILALVIYAFYVIPISAALAPLFFAVPAAFAMVTVLSPDRRRSWRKARDNDARAALSA